MKECSIDKDFVTVKDRKLILKLRGLGAGVEDAEETKLSFLEAAFFADINVLPLKKDELLKSAKKSDKLADEKYFVIKYLRERGYIVRPSLDGSPYLRLHRKGFRPGEDRTYYLIEVVKKNWKAEPDELFASLEFAGRLRKELVIAVVDTKAEKPRFIKFGRMTIE
ncbi:TPA: hypothetical protein EYP38_01755 [Candidatus Micrarchaeota archaeon]|nr:hypothetical protein [Candidatus Micrarchaeota archaeon]